MTYVIFAFVAEKARDKERTDGHAHVAVDVRNAVPPALRLLFLAVERRIEALFQLLIILVQVIQSVPDESPHQIVVHRPEIKGMIAV